MKKARQYRSLTAIGISGYKSIMEEQIIDIKPLTILSGPNSAGKSSIMQPLLLLKQTLESPYEPAGPLLLDGPNLHISHMRNMLPKGQDTFSIELKESTIGMNKLYFKVNEKGIFLHSQEIVDTILTETFSLSLKEGLSSDQIAEQLNKTPYKLEFGQLEYSINRKRCSYNIVGTVGRDTKAEFLGLDPGKFMKEIIENLIHLPGLRGNPERTYKTTSVGSKFTGIFDAYIASIIHHWQSSKNPKLPELGRDLMALGLTWKVSARKVNDTSVELNVGRSVRARKGGASDLVSIADVGFGVSQSLPVVVALLAAEPNQTVYIEQPEIHLHPNAQVKMAGLIAKAVNRGVRVIIETHSSLLLRGVQIAVANGTLHNEKVKLHWFSRRPKDGCTEINSADLDKNGAFGDWPEDFDDVSLNADRDYLDLVEENQI